MFQSDVGTVEREDRGYASGSQAHLVRLLSHPVNLLYSEPHN
jgi:hypothetical protein